MTFLKRSARLALQVAVWAFFIAPWAVVIFFRGTPRDQWPTQVFFVLLALNALFLLVFKIIDHYRGRAHRREIAQ